MTSLRRRWHEAINRVASTALPRLLRALLRLNVYALRMSRARGDVRVGLTSYPARIDACAAVICSLLLQTVRPSEICLHLERAQFQHGEASLPPDLKKLLRQWAGTTVRIEWTDVQGLASYKKLLGVWESTSSPIISIDDDTLYPPGLVAELLRGNRVHGDDTCVGTRGKVVTGTLDAPDGYTSWPDAALTSDRRRVFLTGVGGILYPPRALEAVRATLLAGPLVCPGADDVWFKLVVLEAGVDAAVTRSRPSDFPTIGGTQTSALNVANVRGGHNDRNWLAARRHLSEERPTVHG